MNLQTSIEVTQGGATRAETWTLLHLELREYLDRPYLLTLRVSTPDEVPEAAEFLGARVHVLVTDESGAELVVCGVLRECRYERTIHGKTHMKWTASPSIALAALQEKNRQFVDTEPLEILRVVAQPAFQRFGGGLTLDALRLRHEALDYCVQRGENDLDFALRILSSQGIFWTFDWDDEHEHLVLRDESLILSDPQTNRVLPFSPSGRNSGPSVRELDYGVQLHTGDHRVTSWDWKSPVPTVLESRTDVPFAARFGTVEHADPRRTIEANAGRGPMLDATSAHAAHAAERAAMEATFVHARSTVLDLRPGCVFSVEAHPNPDLERELFVTEVIHVLETYSNLDDAVTEIRYENALNAIPADVRYRPPLRVPPKVAGPETAVVVGDAKSETVTDAHGRVRVRFHWAEEEESCFIRVAQAWAGQGFGTMFVPRPGMEVVVHYLDGDPERPMIVGSVYNAKNTPPYPLPEDRARTTIRTQTYPEGSGANELRFDDTKNRQQVALKAQRRLDVCVSSSMYETVGRNRELRVGGKERGDLNVHVRHDHNHLVSENDYQQVAKEQHRTVEGTAIDRVEVSRRVSTGQAHTVDAETILMQAGDTVDQRATAVRIEGTNGVDVLGSHVSIEATHRMSLRAGDAFITLDPFEGIRLHGVTVGLNSGGQPTSAGAPTAADAFELIKPIEAYGANCACNAGKWTGKGGGGGGRQHKRVNIDPHEPAPYPPGPFPPKKKVEEAEGACKVSDFWVECGHGRRTDEDFIEIVPTKGSDSERVGFSIELSGACEGDASWEVFGNKSLGQGTTAEHVVNAPKWGIPWPPPRRARDFATRTLVMVRPPEGPPVTKTVWAFPSSKIEVDMAIPLDEIKGFIKPLFEMELVKVILETVAEDAKFNPELARGYATCGFFEYWGPKEVGQIPRAKTDNRAFYGYDVGFQLKGEFGGKAGLPIGRVAKLVKKALKVFKKFKYFKKVEKFLEGRDVTVDAVLYIKPDIDVEWLRKSPDDPLWVEPTKDTHLRNEITVGFDLGITSEFEMPFYKEYKGKVELALGVVAIVNFYGRPYLSAESMGAELRYELSDIKITKASLKPPFFDGIEKKDVSLLSQDPEDRKNRSLGGNLDLSFIPKTLSRLAGGPK